MIAREPRAGTSPAADMAEGKRREAKTPGEAPRAQRQSKESSTRLPPRAGHQAGNPQDGSSSKAFNHNSTDKAAKGHGQVEPGIGQGTEGSRRAPVVNQDESEPIIRRPRQRRCQTQ